MKRMKWFLIPSIMVILLAIVGPVAAGVKWSGIDPIFELDDHVVNVRIEFPTEYACDIDGRIRVKVTVPTGTDVNFITESGGSINGCRVGTRTRFIETDRFTDRFTVKAFVDSEKEFHVKVKVDLDGIWVKRFTGESDEWVGGRVKFSDADGGGLGEDPNAGQLIYTYEDDQGYSDHD